MRVNLRKLLKKRNGPRRLSTHSVGEMIRHDVNPCSDVDSEDDSLCRKCRSFNLKLELSSCNYNPQQRRELILGPFAERIDDTTCVSCQLARYVIGCQDRSTHHVINTQAVLENELLITKLSDRQTSNESATVEVSHQPETRWCSPYTFNMAVQWTRECLDSCSKQHGRVCNDQAYFALPHGAYLVDVVENCVVPAESMQSYDYYALSYVCGGAKLLDLNADNKDRLSASDSLTNEQPPTTITDAMSFTRACGARFLWIDSLCMLHGDERNVQSQIDAMDQIYNRASLVIVAVLGSSPDFGLFPRGIVAKTIQGLSF